MGCGTSTLDVEDSSLNPHPNRAHRHLMVPPIVIDKKKDFENGDEGHVGLFHNNNNNNNNNNKGFVMEMKPLGYEEAKDINEGSIQERLKEKSVVERNNNNNNNNNNNKEEEEEERGFEIGGKENHNSGDDIHCVKNVEEEHEDRDDHFIGLGSPSFREYCINDFDYGDPSFMEDSNDCDSLDQSIKNGSDDDDLSNKNKNAKKKECVNLNKSEHEKKERRGRGFRNVISKGKGRGRKNLLNFACYNASNESYVESSFSKVAAKTA